MADPLLALSRAFEAAITAAFGAEHASTDPAIRRSNPRRLPGQRRHGAGQAAWAAPPREIAAGASSRELRLDGRLRERGDPPGRASSTSPCATTTWPRELAARPRRTGASASRRRRRRRPRRRRLLVPQPRQGDAVGPHPQHHHRRRPGARARRRWATGSSARTTSATGARRSACSSSTSSTSRRGGEHASALSSWDDLNAFYKRGSRASSTPTRSSPSARAHARGARSQGGDRGHAGAVAHASSRPRPGHFGAIYGRLGVLLDRGRSSHGESLFNDAAARAVAADLEALGLADQRGRALRVPARLHRPRGRAAAAHRSQAGRRLRLRGHRSRRPPLPHHGTLGARDPGSSTWWARRRRSTWRWSTRWPGWRAGSRRRRARVRRVRLHPRRRQRRCSRPGAARHVRLGRICSTEADERASSKVIAEKNPEPRRRGARQTRSPTPLGDGLGEVRRSLQRSHQGLSCLRLGPDARLRGRTPRPI